MRPFVYWLRGFALWVLVSAGTCQAQVLAQGMVDWQLCFGGPIVAVTVSPQSSFGTYHVTGGLRPVSGLGESMSLECAGSFTVRGRAHRTQGQCVYQDAAGDRIHGADARTEQGYTWTFLGGTGKYEGITGSGQIEVTVGLSPVRPSTLQGCRRLTGSYSMAR